MTKEIFNSHPVSVLKKELSKTNIKGYSKLKKAEVVELMIKNKSKFGYIKMATKSSSAKPQPKKKKIIKKTPKKPSPKKSNLTKQEEEQLKRLEKLNKGFLNVDTDILEELRKKKAGSPKKRKDSFAQLKSFDEDLYGSPKKKSPSPKGPRYLGDIEFGDDADRWWRKNRDKKKYEKMEEDLKDKELLKKGIDPKTATFNQRQAVIDDARKVIRKFINEKILPKLKAGKKQSPKGKKEKIALIKKMFKKKDFYDEAKWKKNYFEELKKDGRFDKLLKRKDGDTFKTKKLQKEFDNMVDRIQETAIDRLIDIQSESNDINILSVDKFYEKIKKKYSGGRYAKEIAKLGRYEFDWKYNRKVYEDIRTFPKEAGYPKDKFYEFGTTVKEFIPKGLDPFGRKKKK